VRQTNRTTPCSLFAFATPPVRTYNNKEAAESQIKSTSWAVRHSDKLPKNSVYSRHSALKMLEIHKVFLRFLP
jgi:hypothetical protein